MNAAVDGGVMVYTSFAGEAKWNLIGGTSLATPETAGVVALAGQLASDRLGKVVGVGQLNPILYQIPSADFNDVVPQTFSDQVTLASNDIFFDPTVLASSGPLVVPPVYVPGYPTTVGYDMTTGWGTPNGMKFLNDVASAVVARESTPKK
jgi:subtilase family serine protease